ncbi:hypothetical protein RFI_23884 [Reticulomyxa filosa]|uniref:Uncharacterized protein n=1 Tax=Reticulomyxa filosa TaxID=46433 RepID=X6MIK7_RETFI|nr:hypothetical protein RFI_23884 [Reticulomyxa filosa]|eukprot:ETO13486.1 hypothetical protein RFI_23884 [Reticulomyxa filosa]
MLSIFTILWCWIETERTKCASEHNNNIRTLTIGVGIAGFVTLLWIGATNRKLIADYWWYKFKAQAKQKKKKQNPKKPSTCESMTQVCLLFVRGLPVHGLANCLHVLAHLFGQVASLCGVEVCRRLFFHLGRMCVDFPWHIWSLLFVLFFFSVTYVYYLILARKEHRMKMKFFLITSCGLFVYVGVEVYSKIHKGNDLGRTYVNTTAFTVLGVAFLIWRFAVWYFTYGVVLLFSNGLNQIVLFFFSLFCAMLQLLSFFFSLPQTCRKVFPSKKNQILIRNETY